MNFCQKIYLNFEFSLQNDIRDFMNVAELKQRISKNRIEHIYLFSGPEIGEKKEIIELLENRTSSNTVFSLIILPSRF